MPPHHNGGYNLAPMSEWDAVREAIRKHMRGKHLSQAKFGGRVGVTGTAISLFLSGDTAGPSVAFLAAVATELGVTVDALLPASMRTKLGATDKDRSGSGNSRLPGAEIPDDDTSERVARVERFAQDLLVAVTRAKKNAQREDRAAKAPRADRHRDDRKSR